MLFFIRNLFSQRNSKKVRVRATIELDMAFVFLVLGLLAFGWIMVTSASMVDANYDYGNPYFYCVRQGFFAVLGIGAMICALLVPTDNYQKIYKLWLIIAFVLLVAVLIPHIGREVNGSLRWIPLIVINVQVSEVVKLCAIMYFSSYLVRFGDVARETFKGVVKPLIILAAMAGLLLKEPDFGASVVMFTCVFGIMFMAGVKLRWFIILIVLGGVAATFLVLFEPYRLARLNGFMNPWADANNTGYQLVQALISYGRGGWFGDGLGSGIQKQFFLPEAHTDFIVSVVAEELGAVGVIVLLMVYAYLIWKGMRIASLAYVLNRHFQSYVAYGISFWVAFQVIVNIGVNIGVLPTKGLTLPLISYGGSSLLIMCFALGILLRIDFENKITADEIMPRYVYKKAS
ncbi:MULTISPECIES: putative lipid II flippase FtsW [Cysteiniphilum]|uniref:Probable peptidoglycan glycosyltransferase FtsW n=1 Tax=Cysteiniphilum litorale TaxID=2056700 RepID=A0A8J2Z4A3_9GAMM|nr:MULTISPECIES: putative lipid II flippase FtsW [Cysteiniphilum]GGF97552.1 putative lipid II flippase FtsW [Cysteiniphilum litorale]